MSGENRVCAQNLAYGTGQVLVQLNCIFNRGKKSDISANNQFLSTSDGTESPASSIGRLSHVVDDGTVEVKVPDWFLIEDSYLALLVIARTRLYEQNLEV